MSDRLVAARLRRESLCAQLRALGVAPGDTAMVHVSLRAIGPILGGPDELIHALRDAVGDAGTLLVYVGAESPSDDLGRGVYTPADEDFIRVHCPPFDPHTARANRDFGYFAEVFRTHPGVRCSANAGARMAALGRHADALTRDHAPDYGLGRGSPLERLCELSGKVLLLGADRDNTTLLHYAEAVAPIPDKRVVRIEVPVMSGDSRVWRPAEEFDSNLGVRDWPERLFADLVTAFEEAGHVRTGHIGGADSLQFEARGLIDFALPRLVALAARLAAGTPPGGGG
jgi:aminoglycoside 3-N-acetyltransferase